MQVKTKDGKAVVKLEAKEHQRLLAAQEVLWDISQYAPKPYQSSATEALAGMQVLLGELFPDAAQSTPEPASPLWGEDKAATTKAG